MLTIFSRLPLSALARVGEVCTAWRRLQATILARRAALHLLIGDPGGQAWSLVSSSYFSYPVNHADIAVLYKTELSALEFPDLSPEIVSQLIADYPHRASLEISISNLPESTPTIDQLARLLEANARTLKSLRLWIRFSPMDRFSSVARNQISRDLFRLLVAINRLDSLKHLTFDCHNQFTLGLVDDDQEDQDQDQEGVDNLDVQFEFPILGQLREFYFYSLNGADSLLDSLARHAQSNQNLTALGIRASLYSAACLTRFLELAPGLLGKFTHLNTHLIPEYYLEDFTARCRNLVTLSTTVIQAGLGQLFAALARLTQLEDLRLYIYFDSGESRPKESEDSESDSAPVLRTVQSLSLYGGIGSHRQMLALHPGRSFPDVRELRIALSLYGCPDCGYSESVLQASESQREECYRHMVRPWLGQCARLERAYLFNVQIPLTSTGLTQSQVYIVDNDDE